MSVPESAIEIQVNAPALLTDHVDEVPVMSAPAPDCVICIAGFAMFAESVTEPASTVMVDPSSYASSSVNDTTLPELPRTVVVDPLSKMSWLELFA